ncbi:MAG: lysophospholipid acyltransferase family protein [Myxococcota bacterium]
MKPWWRTAVTGSTVLGLTGTLAPVVSLLAIKNESLPDPLIHFWAQNILRAAKTHVVTKGVEKLPPGQFVLVLNHQSLFDVPVLFFALRRHLRFVAKKSLFRIPVFGSALKATGNLAVDRKGGERDRETMRHAVQAVRERVNLVFFGEGTRSPDGVLRPFKKGAAVMAIEAGVPLVPAAICGTRFILPKGSRWIFGNRTVALVVGDPLSTAGLTIDDRDALTQRAHAAVEKLLREADELVRS